MGRIFELSSNVKVVCHSEGTRSGFRHIAVLYDNGREVDSAKVTYQNRTWESYEFQSVLQKLIDKTTYLTPEEKVRAKQFAQQDHTDWSQFKAVGMGMAMGDLMGQTTKQKNEFKKGVLESGFGKMGLEFPSDWGTLSESDKKKRLKKVQDIMKPHIGERM